MELLITRQYFMKVEPEWYDPNVLTGEGTLEEQVCEFEKSRVERDGVSVLDLRTGITTVTVVPEPPETYCGDEKKHSKHTLFIEDVKYKCMGNPEIDGGAEVRTVEDFAAEAITPEDLEAIQNETEELEAKDAQQSASQV